MTTFYRQCRLSRRIDTTTRRETVTFLPEQFAVVGRVVKLRQEDRTWKDGWEVLSAGDRRVAESALPDYRKRIRHHRKTTGDADSKS